MMERQHQGYLHYHHGFKRRNTSLITALSFTKHGGTRAMIQHSFSLIPFPDSNIPELQFTGSISRKKNILAAHFKITGQTEVIYFPDVASHPQRKHDLWKTTCFEFFLAIPDKPEYWEFNMSPSGDWNAYHMDAYRQVGLREESYIQRLPFSIERRMQNVIVEASVDLTPLIQEDQQIQAEVTSVIEDQNGHETYWALLHPGPKADFHRREGFILFLNSDS